MSKIVFWIIAVPLAAAIIIFSVNNRTDVVLDLWPLDMVSRPLPVFAIVVTSLFAGFLAGGIASWLAAGTSRRAARSARRQARAAEQALAQAEQKIERLQADAAEAAARPVAAEGDDTGDIPPPRLPHPGF